VFGNVQAFLTSAYYAASPPYDGSVEAIPQTPTHFILRNVTTGASLVAAPIPLTGYSLPFNIVGDAVGQYNNTVVIVEFINVISSSQRRILYGAPVNVAAGTYSA
jgi:hypothetical protein